METAKANALNLERYIQHLFSVLPGRVAQENLEIGDLLPWADSMKKLFALETVDC